MFAIAFINDFYKRERGYYYFGNVKQVAFELSPVGCFAPDNTKVEFIKWFYLRYYFTKLLIVAIIVANEAILVPIPRIFPMPLPFDFGLLGTIISQPGSTLP